MQPLSDVINMVRKNTNELLLPTIELLPSLAISVGAYTRYLLAMSET